MSEKFIDQCRQDLDKSLDIPERLAERLMDQRHRAMHSVANNAEFPWFSSKYLYLRYCFSLSQWNTLSAACIVSVIALTVLFFQPSTVKKDPLLEYIELLSAKEELPVLEQDVDFYLWLAEMDKADD